MKSPIFSFSLLFIASGLLTAIGSETEAAADRERPNVIVVICDDLAHEAMGCYGGTMLETPRLDRMAEQGARFDRAFVTNSICSPSRAAILTGKYATSTACRTTGRSLTAPSRRCRNTCARRAMRPR